jgi:hypothetical protein
MKANLGIMDVGSLELEGFCYELRRFLLSEPKEQLNRTPLIRKILSEARLKETRGFLEEGSANWKNREFLLCRANVALEDMEAELNDRKRQGS